ncbi:hypothetical protein BGW36DRAFT_52274 [Talaromyces proteolyticus]|uniref:Glutathione S-transferase n=1 Tax=Talaromyces proteolyticus TaxID=1131652 RepID=A0AAD4KHN0_9EURO|nr:uncharacterized protein BGW36DRAFT_52274 [Talaromyces proteolyticus]KAH8691427.1 hypothetical protein BGW36DRAFT_52274 [Talaromyces proteolyticus]
MDTPHTPLPAPILHHLSSSQSMRVLWALEELAIQHGLEYSVKYYKRQQGRAPAELKQIFPLGKSPILEIPGVEVYRPLKFVGSSGEIKKTLITESRLILQFLSDKYSSGEWLPNDEDKDRDIFFQEFANSTLSVIIDRITYFQIIPAKSPWIAKPLLYLIFNPIASMFRKNVDEPFELMERALSDDKPWFSGKDLGLADLNMIWPIDSAHQKKYLDEKKYPKLAKWLTKIHERQAYQSALEKGGSYDLVGYDF